MHKYGAATLHQTVNSAADIMSAHAEQVTVLSDSKYKKYFKDTQASACFISEQLAGDENAGNLTLLICDDPEISFLTAVKLLHPNRCSEGRYPNIASCPTHDLRI